jgi:DnaJ-class molecular chaperone
VKKDKNVNIKYDQNGVEIILNTLNNNGKNEVKSFSLSYNEVKKLNSELKKSLDYDKKMNIVTCSTCKGKKRIKSGEILDETIVCNACGGKGYTYNGDKWRV